jgi:hypothetical protein
MHKVDPVDLVAVVVMVVELLDQQRKHLNQEILEFMDLVMLVEQEEVINPHTQALAAVAQDQ